MEASRQEYSTVLSTLSPPQASSILNERVRHVGKLNNEIADWLQERRQVEDAYVQGLNRLYRKQPPGDSSDLGTFASPWTKIVNSTGAIAESHNLLARKIEIDIENPLREFFSSNREIQSLTSMQGSLGSILKDYDNAAKKAAKAIEKARKASTDRFANPSSDVEAAKSRWDSQAPAVFEKLQAVDETRFNYLRDLLTQFQTLEVDQVERNRVAAEQCLNTLLNLDTADEIKAFAIRAADKRRASERPESRATTSYSLAPTPSAASGSNDLSRELSEPQETDSGEIFEEKKTGRLKRLGTVFGRRRSNTPKTPSRPKSISKLAASESIPQGQEPPVPAISDSNWRSPSPGLMSSTQQIFGASNISNAREEEERPANTVINGVSNSQADSSGGNRPIQRDLNQLQEPLQPVASAQEVPSEFTRDNEGFTEPPTANDPISVAQQEAANLGDNAASYNVNIRDAPIHEEGTENATALANVANTLRAAAPSRRNGTLRGRRDVRNTVFVPNPPVLSQDAVAEPAQISQVVSPVVPLGSPSNLNFSPKPAEDPSTSDNHSVRSGMSASQSVRPGPVVKHPEMNQPGLNASIIETISASFEQGQAVKASVIGELALAHNSVDSSAPSIETLRLENFQILEKVAPNPAFIASISNKPGEYTVDAAKISAPGPLVPNVAFKYQIHLSESDIDAQAPLLLMPTWKVEANQTSVILAYSINPAFVSSSSTLVFSNLIIVVHLDSTAGKAVSCQSKPTGTFARSQNLIYWKLGDVTLLAEQAPQKLLARFQTPDGEAKPGQVEARWELDNIVTRNVLGLSILDSGAAAGQPDPFADDSTAASGISRDWKPIECARRLVSGTYSAI